MLSKKMHDLVLEKAERTLLDAIQAGGCIDKSFRDVWEQVLDQYQICISSTCIRLSPSISKDAAGDELFSEDNIHLPPSVAYDCEYSGPKQGFRIYLDQEMHDLCREEQMVIVCLFLVIYQMDQALFDKMDNISSMHKLYEAYPRFHSAVDTIEQALKERSSF